MLTRFRKIFAESFSGVLIFFQPLFAFAAGEPTEDPDWVLSYFLVLLFLSLAVVILLRPSKRSDSAFSTEELTAQHEEAMKKMKGH